MAPLSKVCVTGASGFIASHLIKDLLAKGYQVNGTVRSVADPSKFEHLKKLPGADNLTLFEADLTKSGSFDESIKGCEGVFHCASPFPPSDNAVKDGMEEVVKPAAEGTLTVLQACLRASSVKKVVITSSTAAVGITRPAQPPAPGYVFSESDWNDADALMAQGAWYGASKTLAEKQAWDFVEKEKPGFKVATVCPSLCFGPMLQPSLNTSSNIFLGWLKKEVVDNSLAVFVDVRDVSAAHILTYEHEKGEGRFVCVKAAMHLEEFFRVLSTINSDLKLPSELVLKDGATKAENVKFSTQKLQDLGLKFRAVEETFANELQSLKEKGLLC